MTALREAEDLMAAMALAATPFTAGFVRLDVMVLTMVVFVGKGNCFIAGSRYGQFCTVIRGNRKIIASLEGPVCLF
jgi:hypothetical protein